MFPLFIGYPLKDQSAYVREAGKKGMEYIITAIVLPDEPSNLQTFNFEGGGWVGGAGE